MSSDLQAFHRRSARRALHVAAAVLAASIAVSANASTARAQPDAAYALEWQVAWTLYRFTEWLPAPLPWDLRKRVTRTISIEIDAPIDHVFDAYSDIDNHIGRHAFLRRVITHAEYEDDEVVVRNFTAVEDVPIAGIPVPTNTHAQQRIHSDDYFYESDSWTAPGVVTHQLAIFEDLGNGRTRVTERLVFEAEFLLIDFTVTNGVAAHQATMAAMKESIESGEL